MKDQLLSHQAYNKLKSFRTITEAEVYYSLLHKASDVLKHVTNHYDVESADEQVKKAYLNALACQIEYFYETGQTTTTGLNSIPQVMDLGRTKVSMMAHVNEAGTTVPKSIVCPDIYLYLEQTGLLDGSEG